MGDQAGRRNPPRRKPRPLVFSLRSRWWLWTFVLVEVAISAWVIGRVLW